MAVPSTYISWRSTSMTVLVVRRFHDLLFFVTCTERRRTRCSLSVTDLQKCILCQKDKGKHGIVVV